MTITAEAIADSIGPTNNHTRLITMLCKYPKFIHSEHLRHRSFSFSVSSSRAISVSKNLEEVRSDNLRAGPVFWGREQKGMQSGEELNDSEETFQTKSIPKVEFKTPQQAAKDMWDRAAKDAVIHASWLHKVGAHKSIVNRILEPFLHVNVLVTGSESGWMNFFGLRLDKAAQPEIKALAEQCWKVWNEHQPNKLEPGEWHLPYVDNPEISDEIMEYMEDNNIFGKVLDFQQKISVARCARLSYLSFETQRRSTIEEDLKLYEKLIGSIPIHASPAEHLATPDHIINREPHLGGNLGRNWIQYRKLLPNESIAPLPQKYKSIFHHPV